MGVFIYSNEVSMKKTLAGSLAGLLVLLAGCATEQSRTLEVAKVNTCLLYTSRCV